MDGQGHRWGLHALSVRTTFAGFDSHRPGHRSNSNGGRQDCVPMIAELRTGVTTHEQRDERTDPGLGERVSDLLDLLLDDRGADTLVVLRMQ